MLPIKDTVFVYEFLLRFFVPLEIQSFTFDEFCFLVSLSEVELLKNTETSKRMRRLIVALCDFHELKITKSYCNWERKLRQTMDQIRPLTQSFFKMDPDERLEVLKILCEHALKSKFIRRKSAQRRCQRSLPLGRDKTGVDYYGFELCRNIYGYFNGNWVLVSEGFQMQMLNLLKQNDLELFKTISRHKKRVQYALRKLEIQKNQLQIIKTLL